MSDNSNTNNILCCCEYLDKNNEINHIAACCCNCTDVDEAVDSWIKGKGVSENNRNKLMATLQDRIRIPWRGGAKQISIDSILPIFILPIMFLLASISLWWTIFTFSAVSVLLLFLSNFLIRHVPKTKFFYVWTITSGVILYGVFEFIVIPLLEISFEENMFLFLMIGCFIIGLLTVKLEYGHHNKQAEYRFLSGCYERFHNCRFCQTTVPDKNHHCLWFNCCISRYNQCLFLLTLISAILALLYSSNLTLTSVCHPFVLYKDFLLPDDCSEVYEQFDLSLSFVTAIYSLVLALILLFILIKECWFISIGLTYKEWYNLPFTAKLCCGLFVKRTHDRGFFINWAKNLCYSRNFEKTIIQDF